MSPMTRLILHIAAAITLHLFAGTQVLCAVTLAFLLVGMDELDRELRQHTQSIAEMKTQLSTTHARMVQDLKAINDSLHALKAAEEIIEHDWNDGANLALKCKRAPKA